MTNEIKIDIGKDFSKFPGGRFITDGPFSGEKFRNEMLVPKLHEASILTVSLDNTLGYGSSFLEEAFGGMVRKGMINITEIQKKLRLESNDEILKEKIWSYIKAANKS